MEDQNARELVGATLFAMSLQPSPQKSLSKDETAQEMDVDDQSTAVTLAAMSTPERKVRSDEMSPKKSPNTRKATPSSGGRSPRRKKKKIDPTVFNFDEHPEMAEKYGLGNCVWAKFEGFQWWPSKIMPRDSVHGTFDKIDLSDRDPQSHLCHFFGSYDVAWIPEAKLRHFKPAMEGLRKKCKTKGFLKALEEADMFIATGKEPEKFEISLGLKDRAPKTKKGENDAKGSNTNTDNNNDDLTGTATVPQKPKKKKGDVKDDADPKKSKAGQSIAMAGIDGTRPKFIW